MSMVRTAAKIALGAAIGFAAAAAVNNPDFRRKAAAWALNALGGALKRASAALEAGRHAAQVREEELEKLLGPAPARAPKMDGPDYIV